MQDFQFLIERTQEAAKSRGLTPNKAFVESGAGKDYIAHLRKGQLPGSDRVCKLADYLDCSVDYLLGRTDRPEINR